MVSLILNVSKIISQLKLVFKKMRCGLGVQTGLIRMVLFRRFRDKVPVSFHPAFSLLTLQRGKLIS